MADYLAKSEPHTLCAYTSPHRVKPANLNLLLPEFVTRTLHSALPPMMRQLGNPSFSEVMLYGPEMRSSAPVQITRDESGQSITVKGLFPAGEGAGYAGGIVSSGVDGLKVAISVVEKAMIR